MLRERSQLRSNPHSLVAIRAPLSCLDYSDFSREIGGRDVEEKRANFEVRAFGRYNQLVARSSEARPPTDRVKSD